MLYQITNIDVVIKEFTTDKDFIEYAQTVFDENEDVNSYLRRPDSVETAEHYINTYCSDLELEIF